MAYGALIKKIRKDKNMSMRAFGKLVDVDFTYIGLLERETSSSKKQLSPSIDILKQICDRTDYPFRTFLEEAGYIEPKELSEIEKLFLSLNDDYKEMLINQANALLRTQNAETELTTRIAKKK